MDETGVDIILAKKEDDKRVFKFLQENFFPDEPLNKAMKRSPPDDQEDCVHIRNLEQNVSVLAVCKNDPQTICGLILNKEYEFNYADSSDYGIKVDPNSQFGKILTFLDYSEGEFVKELRKSVPLKTKMFETTIIAVRKENRRQNLGYRLMEKAKELAANRGNRYMIAQCTSSFSAGVFRKHGYDLIYELPFEDYKDKDGEIVFQTEEPHKVFRAFVKKIEEIVIL